MPDAAVLPIFAIFLLAGLVKGVTGMGLPTLAMALLGTFMAPAAAASLLLVPSCVTNVWQLVAGNHFRTLVKRLWPMLLGILIGTVSGASAMTAGGGWVGPALGGALLVYALVGLLAWQPSVPPTWESWLSPLVGFSTGLVTGATGIFVVPAVPYLQALRLPKHQLIQALGLSFTVSTVALALGLMQEKALVFEASVASFLAVLPALAGMWLGGLLRSRINAEAFRQWFLVSLAMLGVLYFVEF